jgi:tetratricopeptide (TPR) repeat protein
MNLRSIKDVSLRALLFRAWQSFIFVFIILFTASTPIHAQVAVKETEQLDFAQGLLSRGMYDMAILQYQKFISDYPQSPSLQEAYLSLGEGYFLSQDFDRAVGTFNQFMHLYPNSDQLPVSVLRLGQIDIQQKKYDEGLKELTSVDATKLKGPMLQSFDYYIAQAYLGKTDTASALNYFQKASQIDGATNYTAYAFKEIGQIQATSGHYSDATDAYAKSLALATDDSLKGELAYRMAEVQFLSGKYTDAIKGFQQVLDQYPNSGFAQDALTNLLLAYFNLGQYDDLLKVYQDKAKVIKDEDTYFPIHLVAVSAYVELKNYDLANTLLDHLLSFQTLKPKERAMIFIKKADILIREKKYKDGLALLDAYSAENIDDADETFFLKAQAYYGIGDYDHAFNFFENVYLNFPTSRFAKAALLGQAHTRQKTGRFKESKVLFMKYVDADDQSNDLKSEALYDAVMMGVKAGDVSGVIESAQDYLKDFPAGAQYGEVLLILADNESKNNQAQDAVNLLQGYLAKPESLQRPNATYFLLGFNQQLLGKNDDAIASYKLVDGHKEEGKFYVAALKNIAIIYLTQKNYDQARVYFDQLISQADQNDLQVQTYIWVCNEYLKQQKYDDVLRIATEAQKHFPPKDLLEINYFKAEALRGQGNCGEAIANYDLMTTSADKNAYTGSAHIGHALCLEKAQKFDDAKAELQKSLDENSDDFTITVHARFETAKIDADQGRFDEALKLYLLIATIYDDEHYCSESLLRAGQIDERFKRRADALQMYREILDKYKNSPEANDAKERVLLLK